MPPYVSAGSVPRVDLGDPAGLAARCAGSGRSRESPAVIERARVFRALCPSSGRPARRAAAGSHRRHPSPRGAPMRSREQAVVVGERRIGPGAPVFIAAEAGVSPSRPGARPALVDAAAECGADAVKFRPSGWTRACEPECAKGGLSGRTTGSRREPARHAGGARAESRGLAELKIARRRTASSSSRRPSTRKARMSWMRSLWRSSGCPRARSPICRSCGTVAQGPAHHLSTGMADLEEVGQAVAAIRAAGDPPLAVLHCLSAYPAPVGEVNLRAMGEPRFALRLPGRLLRITRSASRLPSRRRLRGAAIIEASHARQDPAGTDHRASLDPRSSAPW